jgi:lipocalin
MKNFDLNRYYGKWNEVYKSKDCLNLEKGKCGSDTLTPTDN